MSLEATVRPTPKPRDEIDDKFDYRKELVGKSFDQHQATLQSYAYGMCGDWASAEDLTQKLWHRVLVHFPEKYICELGILKRKMYQIFVDGYRKAVTRRETLMAETPDVVSNKGSFQPSSDEEEAAFRKSFFSDFADAGLSEQQAEALWLNARYSLTYVEIAEKMGVGKSTVGDWIVDARTRILKTFEQ